MIIGIPKEVKENEFRVAMVPAGVEQLKKAGHQVLVETGAGVGSDVSDAAYELAGAEIKKTAAEVFAGSDMIVKVKEPQPSEYGLIKPGQIVFTYFHFAANKPLTDGMINAKCTCIAYETMLMPDGSIPLLTPMSEVAGRMAVQEGAKYLERPTKGRGILLSGVPGVARAEVLVLGGGVVGYSAAKIAAGFGANVTIMDVNLDRMRYLEDVMPKNVTTLYSNSFNIREKLKQADLVIGAVLLRGAKAPVLVTKEMLKLMKPGAVIVDVAVDQGGCIETTTPTTHSNPIFIVNDVVHYCVANMPGAVACTSTYALTNVTTPYVLQLANNGYVAASQKNNTLKTGLNIVDGKVTFKEVADLFDLPYVPVDEVLA